jgi:dihydrolipoamide dehydrogenase
MPTFDLIIIGAGPAGEAATYKGRELGASVAVIDRRWFGGSCPHIGCLPSKALLHSAAEHDANPAGYDWPRASAHRDWMINRAADAPEPDDGGHVRGLEGAGATVYRGEATITARGQVTVRHDGTEHVLHGRDVVVAVGSYSRVPPIPGIEGVPGRTSRRPWPATCREACWSWAVARPAASSPRSMHGSGSQRPSSSRVHGSRRRTTRGIPSRSVPRWSATA